MSKLSKEQSQLCSTIKIYGNPIFSDPNNIFVDLIKYCGEKNLDSKIITGDKKNIMPKTKVELDQMVKDFEFESLPKTRNADYIDQIGPKNGYFFHQRSLDALKQDGQDTDYDFIFNKIIEPKLPAYIKSIDPILDQYLKAHLIFSKMDTLTVTFYKDDTKDGSIYKEISALDNGNPLLYLDPEEQNRLAGMMIHTYGEKNINYFNEDKKFIFNLSFAEFIKSYTSSILDGCEPGECVNFMKNAIDEYLNLYEENKTKKQIGLTGAIAINEILNDLYDRIKPDPSFYKKAEVRDEDFWRPKAMTNCPQTPAFVYLPLNTMAIDGPTPTLDMFSYNFEYQYDFELLLAYIYGTLKEDEKFTEVCWLHGEGSDGKSSLFNVLKEYLPHGLVGTIGAANLNDNFSLEPLMDAKLIIVPDDQSGLSIKSTLVHNITGGDIVSINRKFKPVIHKVIKANLMVRS
jgi:hypothetical protein